jgi:hypothetical protein
MRKLITVLIGGGLIVGFGVWANEDFDVHDAIEPGADQQTVAVPGENAGTGADLIESYQRALEEAQRAGNPNLVQQLMESRKAAESALPQASVLPIVNTAGLPFPLLETNLDRDRDGLSDSDEIQLTTNASNPDTDGDTYADGIEVVRGYNPLMVSPNDKIEYKEPTQANDNRYQITGMRLGGSGENEQLTITGTGPNYSLIAILVTGNQSKLWVTRTDKTGRFIYVSGDTLDIGDYKIYAAAVSTDGETLVASRALTFTRTENALVKMDSTLAQATNNEDKKYKFTATAIVRMAAAGAAGLVLVVLIWVLIRRRRKIKAERLPSTWTAR